MEKQAKTKLTILVIVSLIVTAAASVVCYLALTGDFDLAIFQFNGGSSLGTACMLLPWLSAPVGIAAILVSRRKVSFAGAPGAGLPVVFSSILTGLLSLSLAFFTVVGARELTKAEIFTAAITALSGVYFLIMSFIPGKPAAVVLSFFPAIWAATSLLTEYFRAGEPINSPVRIMNLAMYAFLLLFFTEDIRFGTGRQFVGPYYFCAICALTFTGYAAFPKLVMIFNGVAGFDFNLFDWFLCVAIFLFILARLISAPSAFGPYRPPVKKKKKGLPAKSPEEENSDESNAGEVKDSTVRADRDDEYVPLHAKEPDSPAKSDNPEKPDTASADEEVSDA